MSGDLMTAVAVELTLGGVLLAIGAWGRTVAPRVVPWEQDEDAREQVVRSYLRGSLACRVAGLALILLAVSALLAELF